MSFSASWLALREPHDHAARATGLTDRLGSFLALRPGKEPLRILDLACGSGSTFRYLAPRLGGVQHWVMVDNDPALLALLPELAVKAAGAHSPQAAFEASVEALRLDLAQSLDRLPIQGVDLVTASALLDLVSANWLDRLIGAAGLERPALLLALSYDGSMKWQPALPDDDRVQTLFNRHQLSDKGFGPALGPAAAVLARRQLGAAGFDVFEASSPWCLGPGDQALQRELALGTGSALAAGFPGDAAWLRRWLDERMVLIGAGRSALEVGHRDLLALPAGSRGS